MVKRRIRIFVDSNIIIAGTFFSGLENILLDLIGIDIITADICKEEGIRVTKKMYKRLGVEILKIDLKDVEKSFEGMKIITEEKYKNKFKEAEKLIKKKNDQRVLAAVLAIEPDYFITGDSVLTAIGFSISF